MSTSVGFIDACILARMAGQGVEDIYPSGRTHQDRIPGVTRLEP